MLHIKYVPVIDFKIGTTQVNWNNTLINWLNINVNYIINRCFKIRMRIYRRRNIHNKKEQVSWYEARAGRLQLDRKNKQLSYIYKYQGHMQVWAALPEERIKNIFSGGSQMLSKYGRPWVTCESQRQVSNSDEETFYYGPVLGWPASSQHMLKIESN